jgi:hypothetical protein
MPTTSARRGLTRLVLIVILFAVAWVAVPFKDGDHTCYPAVWSAFRDDRLYLQKTSSQQYRGNGLTVTVFCEAQTRRRLVTSGVVIGIAVAYVVGRRAFTRPEPDHSHAAQA